MKLSDAQHDYLIDLGVDGPLLTKALSVLNRLERLCPEPIEHIFVSETVGSDGVRQFEHLEVFSHNFHASQAIFGSEQCTVALYDGQIRLIQAETEAFDLARATSQSRLVLAVYLHGDTSGTFRATGKNCESLMWLTQNWFSRHYGRRVASNQTPSGRSA